MSDPSREFGKYGLLKVDEFTIEAVASSIERLQAGGGAEEGARLRHALAALMVAAIQPRDEVWRHVHVLTNPLTNPTKETENDD